MKKIIVGQSGGPTAVINASLAGVISAAQEKGVSIVGMVHGIEGFLKGETMNLSDFSETDVEALQTTPGAFLGSCRFPLPKDENSEVYDHIFQKLEQEGIEYFLYIGGNDSMDTVSKLSKQAEKRGSKICFVGVPKTVDNDLIHTDHTPGFGSAAKYIAASVRNVVSDTDAYDMKSVTIMEVMGRHAGWLTGAAALARRYPGDNPALLYLPEVPWEEEKFVEQVKVELRHRNSVVICVSEGVRTAKGEFLCEVNTKMEEDTFGHKLLSGAAQVLETIVRERIGVKVRSFDMGLTQRCASQSLAETDVREAFAAGKFGVEALLTGATGKMVSFDRVEEYRIECGLQDVNLICNQEKTVPEDWIRETDVTEEFINYVRPLMQGERYPVMENGLPKLLWRQKKTTK